MKRFDWRGKNHGYTKQDHALGKEMEKYTKDQIMIYADAKAIKPQDAKTYRLGWNELLQYYLKHQDQILPHTCEFEHENCAEESNGICAMLAGLLTHSMYSESAVLAALHDESVQEILGPSQVNQFFHRLKKFDTKFMPDLTQALLAAGYRHDLTHRYDEQGWDFLDMWVRLRGPCPITRAKPEEMPSPPCLFE